MFSRTACASLARPTEGDGTELFLLRGRANAADPTGCSKGCTGRAGFLHWEHEAWLPPTPQGRAGAPGSKGWRSPGLGNLGSILPAVAEWRGGSRRCCCARHSQSLACPPHGLRPLAVGEQQVWLLRIPEGAKLDSPGSGGSQTSSWHVPWHRGALQAASSSTGADACEPSFPSFAVQRGSRPQSAASAGEKALFMAGNCPRNTFLS